MNSEMLVALLKVAATESGVMPFRKTLSRPPKKALPSVKATE